MIISRLKTLNIFASPLTANNEYELKNEYISTRIFIVMLIASITIIFIYTAQVNITQTIEIQYPSYKHFQSLSLKYSQTLRCSCDNIAISYESFISLIPQLHQVCLSDFITDDWIAHIGSSASVRIDRDFAYMGSLFFLTLSSFCNSANETINNVLQTFKSTKFISSYVYMENDFKAQIDTIINNFLLSTESTYFQSFNLIDFSTRTNALLSSLFSNMDFLINIYTSGFFVTPQIYNDGACDCEKPIWCYNPMYVRDNRINSTDASSFAFIPGMYMSCYLVQAVRISSLECFYQTSCIQMLEDYLQLPIPFNKSILPLNLSIKSRFNSSTSINNLLARIMSEEWERNISHFQYYHQCHVSLCSYSFTSRFNIIYIITTLIGLIGGLTKVYQIIIPRIVKIVRKRLVPPPRTTNEPEQVPRSLIERFRNFNYFSKPFSILNEIEYQQQLISTRLFTLLLLVSFIILISYYGSQRVTITHQIKSPTYKQYLQLLNEHGSNPSFSCPCSILSISNEKFIQIDGISHPLCFSDFILSEWAYTFDINTAYGQYYTHDFRMYRRLFFSSLLLLCETSFNYITTNVNSFYASSFVADKVLSPNIFTAEVNTMIDIFKSSTVRSFIHTLAFISNMTRNNGLISGRFTNFYFIHYGTYPVYDVVYFYTFYIDSITQELCLCHGSTQCFNLMSIYSYDPITNYGIELLDFPGIYRGCLMMESIRYSNLACFFNQSCIDIMSFWNNLSHIQALDMNNLHKFKVNSTIDDIINELFIDQWNFSISHENFYQQCQPDRCTYSETQHNSLWLIITAVFGLIGGLIKIFRVIVPRIVRSIYTLRSYCYHHEQRESIERQLVHSKYSCQSIINQLKKLNIFASEDQNINNEFELENQLISTRIFIILLILSILILTIYSSQVQITKTITISNPSIEQYHSLYKSHSQTLICPCKNINILQHTFTIFQPTFHQICESNFMDIRWTTNFFYSRFGVDLYKRDFRKTGEQFFTTIASFCQLSYAAINESILDFNQTSFISRQVISEDQFFEQIKSLFDLFISTNENSFIILLQNIRDTTHANVLMSGFETSSTIHYRPLSDGPMPTISTDRIPEIYNLSSSILCSCYNDPKCIEPVALYTTGPNYTFMNFIPGIYIGCYIVEATLQSNLVSLYNQTWIDYIYSAVKSTAFNPIPFNVSALNPTVNSSYNQTTPIYDMMKNMMVESWYRDANYSAYYEQCYPIECKYTYIIKYDIIYIITTIIGLIGGLVTVFQFVIPRIVKLFRKCWFNRHHQTIAPIVSLQN